MSPCKENNIHLCLEDTETVTVSNIQRTMADIMMHRHTNKLNSDFCIFSSSQ